MRAAGIDVGGTKILGVTLDGDEVRLPTPMGDEVLDAVVEVVERLGAVEAVGVGLPGLVGYDGQFHVGPNLPGLVSGPVRDRLQRRLGLPVTVQNDASCAAWAEHVQGAGRGSPDMVLVTLGTGIGGGIVEGGRLQLGANGFAAEVGHMIVDVNGPRCPCGRRGCWERFGSGSGLGWLGREAAMAREGARLVALAGGDPEAVKGEHVTTAAREGDPGALQVLDRFAWWVALGISNLVTILDPQMVVVGGGLAEVGELLLDRVRAAHRALVMAPEHRTEVEIVVAELGEHAGAIGAALLASSPAQADG